MADQDIEIDLDSGEEMKVKQAETDDTLENEVDSPDHDDDERATKESDDAEDDNEREAIRERRRKERQQKKVAIKEREETLRRELAARDTVINELRARMDAVDRRNSGSELAQLENAKKQTAQAYATFKNQIRVAGEAGNYTAVADATEKMIQAQRKFDELTNYERAMKSHQAKPQPLDPRVTGNAQKWMDANKWYSPDLQDVDSQIAFTLDKRLAEEGFDATTPEYWDELQSRVKKYLPHRANSGSVKGTKPKSVVSGSGRESSGSSSSDGKSYKLSSDRVQAIKDAGMWDNPKDRAEAVRQYKLYDKQNQG